MYLPVDKPELMTRISQILTTATTLEKFTADDVGPPEERKSNREGQPNVVGAAFIACQAAGLIQQTSPGEIVVARRSCRPPRHYGPVRWWKATSKAAEALAMLPSDCTPPQAKPTLFDDCN